MHCLRPMDSVGSDQISKNVKSSNIVLEKTLSPLERNGLTVLVLLAANCLKGRRQKMRHQVVQNVHVYNQPDFFCNHLKQNATIFYWNPKYVKQHSTTKTLSPLERDGLTGLARVARCKQPQRALIEKAKTSSHAKCQYLSLLT